MSIREKTVRLIDELKATCQSAGLGNDGNEFKIITQVFLYKFLNDKFGYTLKHKDTRYKALFENTGSEWEGEYAKLSEDEQRRVCRAMGADCPNLYSRHLLTQLWNQQEKGDFDVIFDGTMKDIAAENMEIFSTLTVANTKIPIFEPLTQYVTDESQRTFFARALVDKLLNFSFEEAFSEHYDFFADIFEYLIQDYNTAGGGKYAEYYTPHAIATIMARLLAGDGEDLRNIECYDPSAGTGTLLMALAHQIGEDRCTIFSQDISQRSNKMLKLNLILNNLVSSLDHAIQGDTLLSPLPQKRRWKDAAPVRLRGLESAVQDGLLRHAGENRRHACALTTLTAPRISSAEIKPSLCVAHRMPTIPIIVLLAIAKYSTIQNKQKVKHYVQ